MTTVIALALALELGAAAPADLKPCSWPTETKFALKTDPNYVAMTHVKRLKTTCEGLGLISTLMEKEAPLAYVSEAESFASQGGGLPDSPAVELPMSGLPEGPFGDLGSGFEVGQWFPSFGGAGGFQAPVIYTPAAPLPEAQAWLLLAAGLGALAFRRKACS